MLRSCICRRGPHKYIKMKRPYVSRQLPFSVTYTLVISAKTDTFPFAFTFSGILYVVWRAIVKSDRDEIEFCSNGGACDRAFQSKR